MMLLHKRLYLAIILLSTTMTHISYAPEAEFEMPEEAQPTTSSDEIRDEVQRRDATRETQASDTQKQAEREITTPQASKPKSIGDRIRATASTIKDKVSAIFNKPTPQEQPSGANESNNQEQPSFNNPFSRPLSPKQQDLITLGFSPDENPSPEKIKAQYKKKALENHPDKILSKLPTNASSEETATAIKTAEENFKKIGSAYDRLTDPILKNSQNYNDLPKPKEEKQKEETFGEKFKRRVDEINKQRAEITKRFTANIKTLVQKQINSINEFISTPGSLRTAKDLVTRKAQKSLRSNDEKYLEQAIRRLNPDEVAKVGETYIQELQKINRAKVASIQKEITNLQNSKSYNRSDKEKQEQTNSTIQQLINDKVNEINSLKNTEHDMIDTFGTALQALRPNEAIIHITLPNNAEERLDAHSYEVIDLQNINPSKSMEVALHKSYEGKDYIINPGDYYNAYGTWVAKQLPPTISTVQEFNYQIKKLIGQSFDNFTPEYQIAVLRKLPASLQDNVSKYLTEQKNAPL